MGCGVTELMADFTQLITNLQADVDAADSDTSMRDILALLYRGEKITTFHKWYDSANALPIDSAYGGYIAFTKSDNALRVFNDSDMRWAALDSALPPPPPNAMPFQGVAFGYSMGGSSGNVIEKYPYTADGDGADVGDTTTTKLYSASSTSTTHGYVHGGQTAPTTVINVIEKLNFSSEGDATDVGNLTQQRTQVGGSSGPDYGYAAGGYPYPPIPVTYTNSYEKYAFASDGNGTDAGDMTATKTSLADGVAASTTHGYFTGGQIVPPAAYTNVIEKFPFASDGNASDVGDLTVARAHHTKSSSDTSGYSAGGMTPPYSDVIDKFPFSTDANATDVGDLTQARRYVSGSMSTSHGYRHGGNAPNTDTIDKYSFTADGNATDVGNLTGTRYGATGTQV